jgi:hypothetical protein
VAAERMRLVGTPTPALLAIFWADVNVLCQLCHPNIGLWAWLFLFIYLFCFCMWV